MKKLEYTFDRRRLFSGFDGKFCKIAPGLASDGKGNVLLSYRMLLLTGSDVFYNQFISKSTDGGNTFSKPKEIKHLTSIFQDDIRIAYGFLPFYNNKYKKWFGMGSSVEYSQDKSAWTTKNGIRAVWGKPMYYEVDADKCDVFGMHEIPFPFEYVGATPMGQIIEYENGDILVPFYYNDLECIDKTKVVTIKFAFEKDGLKIVKVGTPLFDDKYARGICEPSLAYLNGKYYMTLRSDEVGLLAVSDDGFTFNEPMPWKWDDGAILENYNTQQHWVRNKNGLYLTYTRRGAHNDHVFRHRAPIFMTRFDEDRQCLIKDEEIILVPELGARLGNYNVIEASDDMSYLITAEWMQPTGCEKYGSDNSLWLAGIYWK